MSKIKKEKATDNKMIGVDPGIGEDVTGVSVVGAKTGRLRGDQPNLARAPVRTEEGKELQEAMAGEPVLDVDYGKLETHVVASFGGGVIQLPPERPAAVPERRRGRREEVVSAVNRLKLGLELSTLKHAMGGQNRRARRRVMALTVSLKRKLSTVGVTLEEALAAL